MLASYNSEKGTVEWLSGFKKEIPEISKEVNDFFDLIQSDPNTTFANADEFAEYASGCNIADKTFTNFIGSIQNGSIQLKDGQTMLQGYQSYLQSTTKSLDLANIKTKALSVSMKVLSTVGWMAIFTIASKIIGEGVKLIDDWVHRVENANEAMSNAVSEYDSTKSNLESINTELDEQNKKISELQSKDKLTYAENGQLEELQEITKELLIQQDIEERKAEKPQEMLLRKQLMLTKNSMGNMIFQKKI